MKYEIMQDLVIVGGGAFLLLAGVIAKDPINIVFSGAFFLFGVVALFSDVRRRKP